LAYYPDNVTALTKRGALYFRYKEYAAAARDLEAASGGDAQTAGALQETRIKAYLKSAQPEKAKKELESARENKALDGAWLNKKTTEVQDSVNALKARRDEMERKAAQSRDPNVRVGAAKANLGLGETESALKYAGQALRTDPKNLEAIQITVDAQLQEGDTAKAAKTLKAAERAGVNIKKIFFTPARKEPLLDIRKQ